MTRPKKKRTDLTAPKYVTDRWNSGTTARDEMADLLIHLNGDKDSRSLSLSEHKYKQYVNDSPLFTQYLVALLSLSLSLSPFGSISPYLSLSLSLSLSLALSLPLLCPAHQNAERQRETERQRDFNHSLAAPGHTVVF